MIDYYDHWARGTHCRTAKVVLTPLRLQARFPPILYLSDHIGNPNIPKPQTVHDTRKHDIYKVEGVSLVTKIHHHFPQGE